MRKYIPHCMFIALLGLFVITRLWRLDAIPSGIHIDEAGMAYDAWCLAHYGVDRYLKSWPIYLINFGGGQSILYSYLCATLFTVFDCTIRVIRTPAAIFSFLTFFFGMKICKDAYPEKKYLPLLCGLLLTVCPYFILSGRFGLDCNLMLGASTVFLYFFQKAIRTGQKRYYFIAGLTGGVILYTYALSYIILPLFLLLSMIYVISTRQFHFGKWVVMGIPMGILALPLLLVQYVNMFDKPEFQIGIFTITRMLTYRAFEIGFFSFENFMLALKSAFVGDSFNYNSVPGYLNLYGITIIFFLIGLIRSIQKLIASIKQRNISFHAFPLLWFFCVIFFESHIASNVNKINSIFYVLVFIAIEGIAFLCDRIKQISPTIIMATIGCAYFLCFLRFGIYYYTGPYTYENYPVSHFDVTVTEAIDFLEKHPEYRNKGTYMAENDIYFALSTLKSPYELKLYDETQLAFDNYYICSTLPEIDTDYNYIVRDTFTEYSDTLRSMGYTEIKYVCYSLFYMDHTTP